MKKGEKKPHFAFHRGNWFCLFLGAVGIAPTQRSALDKAYDHIEVRDNLRHGDWLRKPLFYPFVKSSH